MGIAQMFDLLFFWHEQFSSEKTDERAPGEVGMAFRLAVVGGYAASFHDDVDNERRRDVGKDRGPDGGRRCTEYRST